MRTGTPRTHTREHIACESHDGKGGALCAARPALRRRNPRPHARGRRAMRTRHRAASCQKSWRVAAQQQRGLRRARPARERLFALRLCVARAERWTARAAPPPSLHIAQRSGAGGKRVCRRSSCAHRACGVAAERARARACVRHIAPQVWRERAPRREPSSTLPRPAGTTHGAMHTPRIPGANPMRPPRALCAGTHRCHGAAAQGSCPSLPLASAPTLAVTNLLGT